MRSLRSNSWLFLLICSFPLSASEGQEVLDRISQRVSANVRNMPRYTCEEAIERSWFVNHSLDRSDRIRLDVAIGSAGEMFAWHGDPGFRSGTIDELIQNGPISSGTFSSFLNNIFSPGKARVVYQGDGRFTYAMPLDRSSFLVGTPAGKVITAYDGSFAADAVSGKLSRLEIRSDSLPPTAHMSRLEMQVFYVQARLGEADVELPSTVTMDVTDLQRDRTKSVTTYRNCHQFLGESVIRFDDVDAGEQAPVKHSGVALAVPSGQSLMIRLVTGFAPASVWAGDRVEGVLLSKVAGVMPKGTKVSGHVLRAEVVPGRREVYNVDLLFDEAVVEGVTHPLHLEAVNPPFPSQRDRAQFAAGEGGHTIACRFRLAYKNETIKNVVTYWKSL